MLKGSYRYYKNSKREILYFIIYEEETLQALREAFTLPRQQTLVKGPFLGSLVLRAQLLYVEDKALLKRWLRVLSYPRLFSWRLLRWCLYAVLLLPPVFAFVFFLFYGLWRVPLYLFVAVESFFENYLFLHSAESPHSVLS